MLLQNNKYINYLPGLLIVSVAVKLTTVIMIYKIVNILGVSCSIATLILPLWFVIGDIISELYGYKAAKRIVILTIIGQLIFGMLISLTSVIPSSNQLSTLNSLYETLFRNTFRVSLASSLGLLVGGVYNAYIYVWVRDKLLRFDSFMLNSIIASALSEILFTFVVFFIEFHGLASIKSTLQLIAASFFIKQLLTPLYIIAIANPIVRYISARHRYNNILSPHNFANRDIVEIYSCNGLSYFRRKLIPLDINHPLGQYSSPEKVSELNFRRFPAGLTFELHTAPQTQYIIYLEGEVEVETSQGDKLLFKAGDILLANDTEGKGHITRTIKAGSSIVIKV